MRADSEMVLGQFRRWLETAQAEADRLGDGGDDALDPEVRAIGLYQIVEEFSALRQELKLETKSARNLQEQTEAALATVKSAVEAFRGVEAKESQAAWLAGKGLAEALVDLDEALERGRANIERARRRLLEDSPRQLVSELNELFGRQNWWTRWLCRSYHKAVTDLCRLHAADLHRQILDSLAEGYGLILSRIQRALKSEQVRRIQCVGTKVDPNTMTVLEVLEDASRPPGQVIEEIRRGYYWRDRVLRFAEVKAVASERPESSPTEV